MKKATVFVAALILLVLTAVGSFALGIKTERRGLNRTLYSTQAQLWFNHLLQFREIEGNLAKGCSAEALELTRIAVDGEMKLLSDFHRNSGDTSLDQYISDR